MIYTYTLYKLYILQQSQSVFTPTNRERVMHTYGHGNAISNLIRREALGKWTQFLSGGLIRNFNILKNKNTIFNQRISECLDILKDNINMQPMADELNWKYLKAMILTSMIGFVIIPYGVKKRYIPRWLGQSWLLIAWLLVSPRSSAVRL